MRVLGVLWTVATLVASLLATGLQADAKDDPAIVKTQLGLVHGVVGSDYRSFMGLPYAAPPVGDLRWRAPEPPKPWSGVREASVHSRQCAQLANAFVPQSHDDLNEDCLYLNVVTPAPSAGRHGPLPVMVWIHGGGFASGNGYDYDGRRLATGGNVIVVTINYRVGVFGFFGLPDLKGSGDFGLMDQQAALRWVKSNIAAFGGDPDNVTVFGESAGAMSVCAQLVSPAAAGLFQKAILESGTCVQSWRRNMFIPGLDAAWQFEPLAAVEASGAATAKAVGCAANKDAIACLRRTDAATLMKHWGASLPAFGTPTLPLDPARAMREGRIAKVPLMWGHTRDEQRFFILGAEAAKPMTSEDYSRVLAEAFGPSSKQVEALYPATAYERPALAWAAVATDSSWACETLESERLAARGAAVYAFEFADRRPVRLGPSIISGVDLGASHGSEVLYLFGLLGVTVPFPGEHKTLSDEMIGYWTRFAASGDPNGPDLPKWPRFHPGSGGKTLWLESGQNGVHAFDAAATHHCDVWLSPGLVLQRPAT